MLTRKWWLYACIQAGLVLAQAAAAQGAGTATSAEGIYDGSIAGKPIAALIYEDATDGGLWGAYAYLDVGVPIGLTGTLRGGATTLEERGATGRWSGRFTAGGFEGEWASPNGKRRYPLALTRRAAGGGKARAGESSRDRLSAAFYGDLARQKLVEEPREVVAGDLAYRNMVQTASHTSYPRVSRHPDPRAQALINAALERLQLESAAAALECATHGPDSEYTDSVVVELFSSAFMSVSTQGVSLCGTPTFVDWQSAVTYDMKTGQEVDLAREFLVLKPGSGELSDAFLPLFIKYALAGSKGKPLDQDIRDCYPSDDYQVRLSLRASALVVRTDFMQHVAAACETDAAIPYGELARFRKKDSRYRFGS